MNIVKNIATKDSLKMNPPAINSLPKKPELCVFGATKPNISFPLIDWKITSNDKNPAHNKQEKRNLEEQNLNAVIILNPKNEEAIYHLAKLKLNSSDYKKSKELNKRLKSICENFCNKSDKLKVEIENLSKK